MPRLPGISQKDAVRVFQKLGYRIVRESGHLILSNGERRSRPGECIGIKQRLGVVLQGAAIGATPEMPQSIRDGGDGRSDQQLRVHLAAPENACGMPW